MKKSVIKTPISDFVEKYALSSAVRFHMPGHKGEDFTGSEIFDLTEIDGADSLYQASGIIAESEDNASEIFGCKTFYSTEGSSLAIRAMMRLIDLYAGLKGEKTTILAGRNAHSTFLSSAIAIGFKVEWIYPEKGNYLSCEITPRRLGKILSSSKKLPAALYITSPDYSGNIADIKGLAEICKKYGVILAVDNAHGAYLKFLTPSSHPIDLGADICVDSAHKTLPCLTGGAYLHISNDAPSVFAERAKNALALFGSTSPSYLILRSLDKLNAYLNDGFKDKLRKTVNAVSEIKKELSEKGYALIGSETLKITVDANGYGYTGKELNAILRSENIFSEFYDDKLLVLMISPENSDEDLIKLRNALLSIPRKTPIIDLSPDFYIPKKIMEIKEAAKKPSYIERVERSVGKVVSEAIVKCPPAVSVVVGGELVDEKVKDLLIKYGIEELILVK